MNVFAFTRPGQLDWRWRIVSYSGETVEESFTSFETIALAVAEGTKRLRDQTDRDLGVFARTHSSMAWRRRRLTR
jgi:hypothetical protein